jgi:protease IV
VERIATRTVGKLVLLPLLALLAGGCLTIEVGRGKPAPLVEKVVFGERGRKILLLDVDGVLSEQGRSGPLGIGGRESIVARIREQLERAAKDDQIRALIVRVNSPGGTATASDILHQEIARFKADSGVPVVAQLMGVAASGGYYVAMAADTVRAYPTTITGSIGVLFAGVNVSGLMGRLGITDQTLTSGEFKDAGSPLRPMSDPERQQLRSVLEDLFERFLDVVDEGRPALARGEVERLADGRVYSARQALEAGLVDAVGDLPAAVEVAKEKAGLEEARVVIYHRPHELRENLFSPGPSAREPWDAGARATLGELLPRPAFLYLWWPGEP